jgi:hypothetical protein
METWEGTEATDFFSGQVGCHRGVTAHSRFSHCPESNLHTGCQDSFTAMDHAILDPRG